MRRPLGPIRNWFARLPGLGILAAGTLTLAAATLASQPEETASPQPPAAVPGNPLRGGGTSERLPWERQQPRPSAPKLRPAAGAREFLSRYGISDSQWEGFVDGQPQTAGEEEVLVRLLHLYSRFGQENVEDWAASDLSWDQLAAAAAEQRGNIVQVTGRVQQVSAVDLPKEVAARFEFDRYYQVRMQIEGAGYAAVIFCRELPSAWKLDAPLDEQASVHGLFLKIGDAEEEPTPLLFAAHRIAWHPAEPRPEMKIQPAHVALAKLGVDLGRFQEVGQERAIGLLAADREPFYQILAALGSDEAAALRVEEGKLDLVALLQEPHEHHGKMLPVQGLARRVARVEVPDADIRRRFGIDHYFEIDLSLPLEKTIRLGADPKNKEAAAIYENRFPATICVRELPAGLVVGDDVRQSVETSAVFFKIWLYHSAYTRAADVPQPAPLFLARQVKLVPMAEGSSFWSDVVVGALMALAAVAFIGIFLWFRWSDRRHEPLLDVPPPKPDFSDLR